MAVKKDKTGKAKNTFTTTAGNTYETYTPEEFTKKPLVYSDTQQQAMSNLGQMVNNPIADWVDPYKDKYLGYLDKYENRDPFNYDFNSDALYQQYKDQYIQQGQMAMMDTMGQAAAMTGGYGNSYAQTVGQQAYNQQLNQLNAIMPELYDRAYGIYQDEGQEMLNMYNAYLGLSQNDYNQYLGKLDNYYKQMGAWSDYAFGLADMERSDYQFDTNMDWNIHSENNTLGYNAVADKNSILSRENNTLMNQKFTADENKLDREHNTAERLASQKYKTSERVASEKFTAGQNELARNADIEAAALKAAAKSPLDTESTLTWIKKFDGVTSIASLKTLASQFEDVVGPKIAGKWFDLYAGKFEDPKPAGTTGGTGGGPGGRYVTAIK